MKKSLITLCFASIAGAAFAGSEPAPVAAPIDSAKNPVLCVPEPENCFNAGEWTFETGIAGIFVDGDQAAGGAIGLTNFLTNNVGIGADYSIYGD